VASVRVTVLNGVNMDMLGRRDPGHYGTLTLHELETRIETWGRQLGHIVLCRQTNSEADYVDWCHDALDAADGMVVNPGAWTHYSWAIHDALELFDGPIVEVHLSNVEEREEFRRHSVVAGLAALRVVGKGPDGYREALEFLAAA
jgi:3-dehydroquinate dehydratase-2